MVVSTERGIVARQTSSLSMESVEDSSLERHEILVVDIKTLLDVEGWNGDSRRETYFAGCRIRGRPDKDTPVDTSEQRFFLVEIRVLAGAASGPNFGQSRT